MEEKDLKDQIKNEAANNVSDNIAPQADLVFGLDEKLEKLFISEHFDLMIELGKIGVIVERPEINKDGKFSYPSTLPFKFEIKAEDGSEYTHYIVAQKAKQIIKNYRKKLSEALKGLAEAVLFNDEEISFYYHLRDDTWNEERRNTYIELLEAEKNATLEALKKGSVIYI